MLLRILMLASALLSTTAFASEPTCPDGQRIMTFIELDRYATHPGRTPFWGMRLSYGDGGGIIGSAVPEWELEAIRQDLDLPHIRALIGAPFCVRELNWNFAINDKAVKILAEKRGQIYTTPSNEEILEIIADALIAGQRLDLRNVTEVDQLQFARDLFTGEFTQRKLRPKVFDDLARLIVRKSDGKMVLRKANDEDFKLTDSCLCGHAYLQIVKVDDGSRQLVMISELLPVVTLDPGKQP